MNGDGGYVRDVWRGRTERVSVDGLDQQLAGESGAPSISADGRFVAFASGATATLPDRVPDVGVYVRDRLTQTTRRLDVPRHPGAPTIRHGFCDSSRVG